MWEQQKLSEEDRLPYDIVTSLLLQPLQQRLIDVTSFRISKSLYNRSVLFKPTNKFVYVFTNCLGRRIYEIKFPTHVSSFFIFYL